MKTHKALLLFLPALGAMTAVQSAARADQVADDAAASARDEAIRMQSFIVSATQIERDPWYYASLPEFEVLSRATDRVTNWQSKALLRGFFFENQVLPKDWLPQSPVPYTVIIDDVDLNEISERQIHSLPMDFRSPADPVMWGDRSESFRVSSDAVVAHDADTYAANFNLNGVKIFAEADVDVSLPGSVELPAVGTVSLERLRRCTPPLPKWLFEGLFGLNSGIFRESFVPLSDYDQWGRPENIRGMAGPGTLWVSLDETQQLLKRLKKNKSMKIAVPPMGVLFAEAPVSKRSRDLWESEAGLFARWGLMGPGHVDPVLSRAFLELVRRARLEPVDERMFTECFGFGYGVMEEKLESFLKTVLAQPITVDLAVPFAFPGLETRPATSDEIGRILGDWLRMKGDTLRGNDPELGRKFLATAGRILERAYRDDNGLPPDVAPPDGQPSGSLPGNSNPGSAVVMRPLVVSASRIHDTRLLAVYGLYEHDIGNDGKARELLEAAAKAKVARPQAYVVLAKLRYAEAIGKPLGPRGTLSARQAASVLEPLHAALRYAPTPDVSSLVVETWNHCDLKPSERDVEDIVGGIGLFPRDVGLAYSSAVLCARAGYTAQAVALIDKGILFTPPGNLRDYFERLRLIVAATPGPGAR